MTQTIPPLDTTKPPTILGPVYTDRKRDTIMVQAVFLTSAQPVFATIHVQQAEWGDLHAPARSALVLDRFKTALGMLPGADLLYATRQIELFIATIDWWATPEPMRVLAPLTGAANGVPAHAVPTGPPKTPHPNTWRRGVK